MSILIFTKLILDKALKCPSNYKKDALSGGKTSAPRKMGEQQTYSLFIYYLAGHGSARDFSPKDIVRVFEPGNDHGLVAVQVACLGLELWTCLIDPYGIDNKKGASELTLTP